MNRREMVLSMGAAGMLLAASRSDAQGTAGPDTVYELRVYHTFPGKLDGLMARFRDHTMTIFKRHGIESVAYWTPDGRAAEGQDAVLHHAGIRAAKPLPRTGPRFATILSGSRSAPPAK